MLEKKHLYGVLMIFRTDVTIKWYIVLHILLYLYNNNKELKIKK
jgi:hypothetical protein